MQCALGGSAADRPGEYGSAVLVFSRFFSRYSRMDAPHFSLLRILADGRFHSGERLGRALGSSRAGVRKLLGRIEALGARVIEVRGRGYRLAERIDLLEPDVLAAQLGRISPELRVDVLDECPSTNSVLGGRAARRGARLRAPEHGTRPARKFLGVRCGGKSRVLRPVAFSPGRRSARGPEPRRGGGRCALARTAGHPRRESQMAERSVLRGTQARRNIDRGFG